MELGFVHWQRLQHALTWDGQWRVLYLCNYAFVQRVFFEAHPIPASETLCHWVLKPHQTFLIDPQNRHLFDVELA